MKFVLHFVLAIATLSAITACGLNDKEKNSEGTVIASLPQPSNRCMQQGTPNVWDPYEAYGFQGYAGYHDQNGIYHGPFGSHPGNRMPYPQPFAYPTYASHAQASFGTPYGGTNSGFCGCPMGTVPVCDSANGMGGMGCIQSSLIANQPYSTWQWNGNGQSWQHNGWGSMQMQNNCSNSVAHACRVGTYDCGMSATCMPTGNGSPRGVCVRH